MPSITIAKKFWNDKPIPAYNVCDDAHIVKFDVSGAEGLECYQVCIRLTRGSGEELCYAVCMPIIGGQVCFNLKSVLENDPLLKTDIPSPGAMGILSCPNYSQEYTLTAYQIYRDPDNDCGMVETGKEVEEKFTVVNYVDNSQTVGKEFYKYIQKGAEWLTAMPETYELCQDTPAWWKVYVDSDRRYAPQVQALVTYSDGSTQSLTKASTLTSGDNAYLVPIGLPNWNITGEVRCIEFTFALLWQNITYTVSRKQYYKCCNCTEKFYFIDNCGAFSVIESSCVKTSTFNPKTITICEPVICANRLQGGNRTLNSSPTKVHTVYFSQHIDSEYLDAFLSAPDKYWLPKGATDFVRIAAVENAVEIFKRHKPSSKPFSFTRAIQKFQSLF